MMYMFWADRLNSLRDEDRRLDAVLDLHHLEAALREPRSVDMYGLATVYKARLLRRQSATAGEDDVLTAVLQVVDEVLALSTAG